MHSRAGDALHLQAVADVDAGGADPHAGAAVDAVGVAPLVVGDDEGVPVEEHPLQLGVGAGGGAEAAAQEGQVEEEDRAEHGPGAGEHRPEPPGDEPRRGTAAAGRSTRAGCAADEQRRRARSGRSRRPAPRPPPRRRPGVAPAGQVAEDGLRAGPAAPDPPEGERHEQEQEAGEERRRQERRRTRPCQMAAPKTWRRRRPDVEAERALAADGDEGQPQEEDRLGAPATRTARTVAAYPSSSSILYFGSSTWSRRFCE